MSEFELMSGNFKNTSEVPKAEDLFYLCLGCNSAIPSIPTDNLGCECGNVFIDKDYWRLVVADFSKLQVVKKKR